MHRYQRVMCMKLRWRALSCLLLGGILIWFLADAAAIRQSASEALVLCARSVIPALFPFLVVSTLLLGLGFGDLLSPLLAGLMEPLYHLPGCAGSALLLGLVGGYPIGAATAAELYRSGALKHTEAQRLLTFCNNSNPVFLISVLGVGVFGSVRTGVWLWLIHLLSALLTGLMLCRRGKAADRKAMTRPAPSQTTASLSALFVRAVKDSAAAMLSVCGFVVFFYVTAAPLSTLGHRTGPVLVGLLELFSLTPLLTADRFNFILAAAMSGWGGVSVLCQTAAVLEGSGLRVSVAGKAVQGLLSAALAALLSGYVLT